MPLQCHILRGTNLTGYSAQGQPVPIASKNNVIIAPHSFLARPKVGGWPCGLALDSHPMVHFAMYCPIYILRRYWNSGLTKKNSIEFDFYC